MDRNVTESDFWTSKMATGGHFLKNMYKKSCASDLNNVRTDCWPTTTYINSLLVNIYIYMQTAMLGTREYTLCSPFRANAHNSSCYCYQLFISFCIII